MPGAFCMSWGILVDDQGEAWADGSAELRRKLATDRTGQALSGYVVKTLGFVLIRSSRTGCVISMDADTVSPYALIGTLYWLTDNRPERVVVEQVRAANTPQLMFRYDQAVTFVAQKCDARSSRPLFTRHPIMLGNSPFAARWEAVKEIVTSPDIQEHVQLPILDKLLQGYFTLSRRDPETGRYMIEHVGNGIAGHVFGSNGRAWPALGKLPKGKTFANMSDEAYGTWLDDTFSALSEDTAPFCEFVEATLGASTHMPQRIKYSRLVLPYTRASGAYLLTASDTGR
jgi:hypothetical protein